MAVTDETVVMTPESTTVCKFIPAGCTTVTFPDKVMEPEIGIGDWSLAITTGIEDADTF
jgi:hypothetical protein